MKSFVLLFFSTKKKNESTSIVKWTHLLRVHNSPWYILHKIGCRSNGSNVHDFRFFSLIFTQNPNEIFHSPGPTSPYLLSNTGRSITSPHSPSFLISLPITTFSSITAWKIPPPKWITLIFQWQVIQCCKSSQSEYHTRSNIVHFNRGCHRNADNYREDVERRWYERSWQWHRRRKFASENARTASYENIECAKFLVWLEISHDLVGRIYSRNGTA